MQSRILVVDVRSPFRSQLAGGLEEAGFRVTEAAGGREGWRCFEEQAPDVVITDAVMPGRGGLELLARIRRRSGVPVIVFSADPKVETAVAALKGGADEFVPAGDDGVEAIVGLAQRCAAKAEPPRAASHAPRLVGGSPGIQRARERLKALAALDHPVLLSGEPGTGRETAARLLHHLSGASGPFVHIRRDTPWPDSPVRGGMLYLDGFDGCSQEDRRDVAACLAQRSHGPPAGRIAMSVSRVEGPSCLAALLRSVSQGLAARVFEVPLPALRERPEDIPRIARDLVARFGQELGRPGVRLGESAMQRLRVQPWPGNVSELARVLERLVAFTESGPIEREEVDVVLAELCFSVAALRDQAASREREELVAALREAAGNVTRTASILGRSRAAVYRLVEKHGVPLRREP